MKRKLVLVEWSDAWSSNRWVDAGSDKCEPSVIKSIGFLLKRNTHGVLLAASLDETFGNEGSRQFIPNGCITKIKVIRPA